MVDAVSLRIVERGPYESAETGLPRDVEAAYAQADTTESWLQNVVEALRSVVDYGVGAAAYQYDARGGRFEASNFVEATGDGPALRATGFACFDADPLAAGAVHGRLPRVGMSEELCSLNPSPEGMRDAMLRGGLRDALDLKAHDLRGFGCAIIVPSRHRIALAPRKRAALQHVAAHFAAACRLRGIATEPLDAHDAVLSLSGKALHLKHIGARALLEEAVARRARAHRLRSDAPEHALALWDGLVSGRWSLVDYIDRDGKPFVLARKNAPVPAGPAALSEQEHAVALFTVT